MKAAKGDVPAAVQENVRARAGLVGEAAPVVAKPIRDGKLKAAGVIVPPVEI